MNHTVYKEMPKDEQDIIGHVQKRHEMGRRGEGSGLCERDE
jgi:hypothetical protein